MKNSLIFSRKLAFLFYLILFSTTHTYAQCKLIEVIQYNTDNKINARQINTFDKKGNLIDRTQSGPNVYQSQTSFDYNDQNKAIKTTTKTGNKVVKVDSISIAANEIKETKNNLLGEKTTEETVVNANNTLKTIKDSNGNIIGIETTQYQNGKLVFKEIKNDKNQIVSRETVGLDANQNPLSIERFDGISNLLSTEKFTYNTNNQLVKSEKLINNVIQFSTNNTYQKNKLIRKDNYDKDNSLVYYQTFTHTNNLTTETIFYRGVLHSKIITTFDKLNNPIEIQNFNEKQKLTSKIINVFDCTQKL
jgi:hypothetical protein